MIASGLAQSYLKLGDEIIISAMSIMPHRTWKVAARKGGAKPDSCANENEKR